jgi:thiamine-monophosphate kinase
MIDVSDGLLADAGHVATASGVGIDLHIATFEVPEELADAARTLRTDPLNWILTGGDDHALLATFPVDVTPPAGWRTVGRVIEGSGVTVDGRRYDAGPPGWEHFK